jgi:hypothetical protein
LVTFNQTPQIINAQREKQKYRHVRVIIIEAVIISSKVFNTITDAAAIVFSLKSFLARFHIKKLSIIVVIIEENLTTASELKNNVVTFINHATIG